MSGWGCCFVPSSNIFLLSGMSGENCIIDYWLTCWLFVGNRFLAASLIIVLPRAGSIIFNYNNSKWLDAFREFTAVNQWTCNLINFSPHFSFHFICLAPTACNFVESKLTRARCLRIKFFCDTQKVFTKASCYQFDIWQRGWTLGVFVGSPGGGKYLFRIFLKERSACKINRK